MISQFAVLTRIKRVREDKALEALQRARREADEAEEKRAKLEAEVKDSAATLPARTAALWDEVMGQVVDLAGLDKVKEKALELERAHLKLVDRLERAEHVLAKKLEAVAAAAAAYREAQRDHEKFADVLGDMRKAAAALVVTKEEAEVEDLFSRPRRSAA